MVSPLLCKNAPSYWPIHRLFCNMGAKTFRLLLHAHDFAVQSVWRPTPTKLCHSICMLHIQFQTLHRLVPPYRFRQPTLWLVSHHHPWAFWPKERWAPCALGTSTRYWVPTWFNIHDPFRCHSTLERPHSKGRGVLLLYPVLCRWAFSMGWPRFSERGRILLQVEGTWDHWRGGGNAESVGQRTKFVFHIRWASGNVCIIQ